MHITTTEDFFKYNFKKVLEELKEDFPHSISQSPETLRADMWTSRYLQESFTRKMMERALEYYGDDIFK